MILQFLRRKPEIEARFWNKVDKSGDCWIWTAARNAAGYGAFGVDGIVMRAHRVALILEGVDIPPGMIVMHSCDNPPCVKPDHLSVGTQLENMRDRDLKGHGRKAVPAGLDQLHRVDVKTLAFAIECACGNDQELAELFDCTPAVVAMVRSGLNN